MRVSSYSAVMALSIYLFSSIISQRQYFLFSHGWRNICTVCRTSLSNHYKSVIFASTQQHFKAGRYKRVEEEPNHHSVMSTLEGLIQDYSLRILLNIFYRYNLTRANKNIQESFKELKVKQWTSVTIRRVHRHVIKEFFSQFALAYLFMFEIIYFGTTNSIHAY